MSILVGRMYRFQCDRCGYRVDSIGGQLQGPGFELITIDCRHCRRLFDVLSKIELLRPISERVFRPSTSLAWTLPPSRWSQVEQHMGLVTGSLTRKRDFRYRLKAHTPLVKRPTQTIYQLVIECPRKASHPVRKWQEPGRCPKCADYLQRGAMPYREWDD
ncbi:MAG: hypothetical protein ACPHDL_01575 [Limisphaerales bacterium]